MRCSNCGSDYSRHVRIMLLAPQGNDVDTLGHEFAHYLEWLDNRDTYDDHGERRVEPYESTVGDTLSRLGL